MFALIIEIRRAAMVVPANISEGQGRSSPQEFVEFLSISLEALAELEDQLLTAKEWKNLTTEQFKPLLAQIEDINRGLQGLVAILV
jgi:four helix bundle protein